MYQVITWHSDYLILCYIVVAKMSYNTPEDRAAAKTSYHMPEVRSGSREEQPHIQGVVAAWAQEGLEELFHFQGKEGWW